MSHTHTFSGTTGAMSQNSTHSHIQQASQSNGNIVYQLQFATSGSSTLGTGLGPTGNSGNNYSAVNTKSADISHTHNYSGTTSTSSISETDAVGKGTAIPTLPPYIIKYCWERID